YFHVTGVQTCALPISAALLLLGDPGRLDREDAAPGAGGGALRGRGQARGDDGGEPARVHGVAAGHGPLPLGGGLERAEAHGVRPEGVDDDADAFGGPGDDGELPFALDRKSVV